MYIYIHRLAHFDRFMAHTNVNVNVNENAYLALRLPVCMFTLLLFFTIFRIIIIITINGLDHLRECPVCQWNVNSVCLRLSRSLSLSLSLLWPEPPFFYCYLLQHSVVVCCGLCCVFTDTFGTSSILKFSLQSINNLLPIYCYSQIESLLWWLWSRTNRLISDDHEYNHRLNLACVIDTFS